MRVGLTAMGNGNALWTVLVVLAIIALIVFIF